MFLGVRHAPIQRAKNFLELHDKHAHNEKQYPNFAWRSDDRLLDKNMQTRDLFAVDNCLVEFSNVKQRSLS